MQCNQMKNPDYTICELHVKKRILLLQLQVKKFTFIILLFYFYQKQLFLFFCELLHQTTKRVEIFFLRHRINMFTLYCMIFVMPIRDDDDDGIIK